MSDTDPLLCRSLTTFWAGMALAALGILLDPPKIMIAINPKEMD